MEANCMKIISITIQVAFTFENSRMGTIESLKSLRLLELSAKERKERNSNNTLIILSLSKMSLPQNYHTAQALKIDLCFEFFNSCCFANKETSKVQG
jgi:hypothetical protein